jgi:bacillithiol biosynthesis deacetylase BshB1
MKEGQVPRRVSTKQVCVVVFSSAAKIEKTGQINGFQVPISSKRNVKFAIYGHLQRANLLTYINFMEYRLAPTFALNSISMTTITLDILAFGAHPDDVEISCGATLIRAIEDRKTVGLVDLTAGEMGSRGSRELRLKEAENAGRLMGLTVRENLEFRDCFIENDELHRLKVIEKIRQYRPSIVLANSPSDRHPDHARASELVREACFYSGLAKIETTSNGMLQEPWRPRSVFMYIQDYYLTPSFVVDISGHWDKKVAALKCYGSQFHDPTSTQPQTPISGEEFFDFLYGKALSYGRPCGFTLGEGFITERAPGVDSLNQVF